MMKRLTTMDSRLRLVLAKGNDRLLNDVGLSREQILGPVRSFWSGWDTRQAAWRL